MAIFKMQIEDFDDHEYTLVAIHSQLEDYRLAYFLNQNLNLLLHKEQKKVVIKSKFGETFFSKFTFENEELDMIWTLIQNKNEIVTTNSISNLFATNTLQSETNVYLLSELKNVDYLLKIENPIYNFDLSAVLNKISTIDEVMTTYIIPNQNLISKNNLIF